MQIEFTFCACGCGTAIPLVLCKGRMRQFRHGHGSWRPPEQRFWRKVHRTPTCWEWTGSTGKNGRGEIEIGRRGEAGYRRMKAYRFSWELHHGPIPPGMLVCHRCDNPRCVRPEHLYLGTQKQNAADYWSKLGWRWPENRRS